ncbi:MAG: sodium-independent anion transporter [Rugosibacter sp.]
MQVVEDSSDGTVGEGLDLPPHTLVYRIDGPFFFGVAEKLEHTLDNILSHMRQIVLRLDRVPFVDATGMQSLADMADDFRRHGTRLVLCEVRPNVLEKLQRAGVLEKVGAENVYPTLRDFVQHAQAISFGQSAVPLPH